MSLSRSVTMSILALMASAWAGCCIIVGLWLALETPDVPLLSRLSVALIGVTSIAVGNLVFMWAVADRLIPSVARGHAGWLIEMSMLSVILTTLFLGARLV